MTHNPLKNYNEFFTLFGMTAGRLLQGIPASAGMTAEAKIQLILKILVKSRFRQFKKDALSEQPYNFV